MKRRRLYSRIKLAVLNKKYYEKKREDKAGIILEYSIYDYNFFKNQSKIQSEI